MKSEQHTQNMDNLKLETLAPLFGYNSAYLEKIFTKKVGESFNSYLDRVRIEQLKILLEDETLKVYEIAERIGYKNVDYFHKKFKKYASLYKDFQQPTIQKKVPCIV